MSSGHFRSRAWADVADGDESADPWLDVDFERIKPQDAPDSVNPTQTKAQHPQSKEQKRGSAGIMGDGSDSFASGPTTVVMRNIPVRCNMADLLATVQASGFQGIFEYLYLPLKHNRQQNRGYVLCHFKHGREAGEFCKAVAGSRVCGRESAKAIQVTRNQTTISVEGLAVVEDLVVYEVVQGPYGLMVSGSCTL